MMHTGVPPTKAGIRPLFHANCIVVLYGWNNRTVNIYVLQGRNVYVNTKEEMIDMVKSVMQNTFLMEA